MPYKKFSSLVFSFTVLASLMSCGDKGTDAKEVSGLKAVGPEPISRTYTFTSKIKVNTNNYLPISKSCAENGVYQEEESKDTVYFNIENKQLLSWQSDDCAKDIATGNQNTLFGTWQYSGSYLNRSDVDTTTCHKPNTKESVTGIIQFTSSEYIDNITYSNWCWSSNWARGTDTTYQSTGACNQYTHHKNGKVATITLLEADFVAVESIEQFEYNGKICTRHNYPDVPITKESCLASWNTYQADTSSTKGPYLYYKYLSSDYELEKASLAEYNACVSASGFNDVE